MCKTCTNLAHKSGIICTKLAHFLEINRTFDGGRSHRTTRQTVIECADSTPFWRYRPSDFMPQLYHYNDSPAANGRIKRTMSAVDFRDKTQA